MITLKCDLHIFIDRQILCRPRQGDEFSPAKIYKEKYAFCMTLCCPLVSGF